MAGVHVGDGAIIAVRAVVTKNVPPYTIVSGVPAKEIRKRYDSSVIDQLVKLQWWNWSVKRIQESLPYLEKGILDKLASTI